MNKYLAYFRQSFKNNVAYKANFFLSLVIDVIFFFVSFVLWRSVYTEGNINQINSYTLSNTITYFFGTSILFRLEVSGSIYLNWQIWSGYFTNDLIKPWSITLINVIDVITEKIVVFALYIPILLIIYFSASKYLNIPDFSALALFAITTVLSMFMSVAYFLIFNALALHWGDQGNNIELVSYLAIFFAGAFFPLDFLQGISRTIFMLLPFKYMFYVPIQVFLGKMTTSEILTAWMLIIIWTLVFYLIYKQVYKKGLEKYSGTGR